MAFTGVPVVKRVSDSLIRVTGISLAASAVGSISLFDGAGGIKLPDDFNPTTYQNVTLQDSIELSHLPCVPIQVVKTGTTPQDWLATLTNLHTMVTNGLQPRSAMFFGQTPTNYPAPIAAGAAVPFPQVGPQVGGGIVPGGTNQFILPDTGIYRVSWEINAGPSQSQVALNGVGIANTVAMAGATDGPTTQVSNEVLISATAGQLLSIINPVGNGTFTVQVAGGNLLQAQAPSLLIELVPPTATASAPAATGALEIYIRHH